MKVYTIVASINELLNLAKFKDQLIKYKIIVIDEGHETIRNKNKVLLQDFNIEFYGSREREEWFKSRFGSDFEKYLSIIPEKCHSETSFGFLVAYEEGADVILELDDDVFPIDEHNLIGSHLDNLLSNGGIRVSSKYKWYNTLENLTLNGHYGIVFPRGHPYLPKARVEDYIWKRSGGKCVLDMGLWAGHPDLDALTILYNGGLDGRCNIKSVSSKRDKVIVDNGTYFAICSMNTSFFREIIPAFYQLYMKSMGIDRFDDIWSGIFVKKIADHLGDNICLGKPLVFHDKRPRCTYKDLRSELEGMVINEELWRIVGSIELNDKDYYSCYWELTNGLEMSLDKLSEKLHMDFIKLQVRKMRLWLDIIDKL